MKAFPQASLPHQPEHDQVRELLLLRAVLPALAPLLENDAAARSILGAKDFVAGFGRADSPALTFLHFQAGKCRLLEHPPHKKTPVHLDFGDTAETARFLLNRSRRIRIRRGVLHPILLACLSRLTLRLKSLLLPPPDRVLSAHDLLTHLRLALGVATAGLGLLTRHDSATRHLVSGLPDGALCFEVAGTPISVALKKEADYLEPLAQPPVSPAAVIRFANPRAAADVLAQRLDSHAALCLGMLSLRGLVPLADGVGATLDRLNLFMTA